MMNKENLTTDELMNTDPAWWDDTWTGEKLKESKQMKKLHYQSQVLPLTTRSRWKISVFISFNQWLKPQMPTRPATETPIYEETAEGSPDHEVDADIFHKNPNKTAAISHNSHTTLPPPPLRRKPLENQPKNVPVMPS